MKVCTIDGCGRDTRKGGKGLCSMHRCRVRRTGQAGPSGVRRDPNRDTAFRVYPRLVVTAAGCWEWTGARNGKGYGVLGIGQSLVLVHRWVYEDLVGPIPPGLVLDHHCLATSCANPEHVEPVTSAVNSRRGGLVSGERRVR